MVGVDEMAVSFSEGTSDCHTIVIGIVTIIVVYLTSRRALTAQWVQTRSSRDEGRTSIGQYLGFRL